MRTGIRIGHNIYLENGEKFDWPELSADDGGEEVFCYGLRDQIGVLCDGTVVPCCLDHNGDIPLGNLHIQSLAEILEAPRTSAIIQGFSCRKAVEPLCRRCGFARRFK
jgi:sulfatase maturation enzyme AslB (radical SAM superfamily)